MNAVELQRIIAQTVTLRGPGPVDAHIATVARPAQSPAVIAESRPWYAQTWR